MWAPWRSGLRTPPGWEGGYLSPVTYWTWGPGRQGHQFLTLRAPGHRRCRENASEQRPPRTPSFCGASTHQVLSKGGLSMTSKHTLSSQSTRQDLLTSNYPFCIIL